MQQEYMQPSTEIKNQLGQLTCFGFDASSAFEVTDLFAFAIIVASALFQFFQFPDYEVTPVASLEQLQNG